MKRYLLTTALVLAIGSAYADNEALERAKDHAQPIPNASLTTQTVKEQTTIVEGELGTAVNTTKAVSVDNSEQGQLSAAEASSSELILPEGRIIDNQMNLSQTIDQMQSAFEKLQTAATVSAMQAQANILTEYAGQAAVLLERGVNQDDLPDYEQTRADLKQLRGLLIELNTALDADDFELAKTKVDIIAQAQGGFYSNFQPQ